MLIPPEIIQETASRMRQFDIEAAKREAREKAPRELESKQRLADWYRWNRTALPNAAEAGLVFERIINGNDLTNINYLERGMTAAKSVGRVHVRDSGGDLIGYGTGFLVAPNVVMTNNHVLPQDHVTAPSELEFDFEYDARGADRPTITFALKPQDLFYTSRELDFTLVAVDARSRNDDRPLSNYSWLKLVPDPGKALVGSYLTIIQHPGGQRKQVCVRENQLIRMDDKILWYATDTLGGSSGSPVLNNNWQVVALHHSGVPKTDAQGRWLTIDGRVWDNSMDESLIQWVANEGVRISTILEHIRQKMSQHPLVQQIFSSAEPPTPVIRLTGRPEVARREDGGDRTRPTGERRSDETSPSRGEKSAEGHRVTVSVPLEISVRVAGAPAAAVGESREPAGPTVARPVVPAEEKISIDPNYSNRQGFDEKFLGSGERATPLPKLNTNQLQDVARLKPPEDGNRYVLHYHHFSIAMNAKRRIAFYTAVNIDGAEWIKIDREKDVWYRDPRIAEGSQTNDDLYEANDLDRGHLVRRLDPTWGAGFQVAKVANDDTFHFTNCSPQHRDLNQKTWAGLEDYILKHASQNEFRANVFTGPVFSKSDPPYRGVRLPKQFWKVAVMIRPDGKLSATAYVLSQAQLIKDIEAEEFAYGKYKTYQVPIRKVAELTGFDFGHLRDCDPLATVEEALGIREIIFAQDIRV